MAEELCQLFVLCADQIKPAGSLRRGTATCKDIELIMLGRQETRPSGLFGDPEQVLSQWEFVNDLVKAGTLAMRKDDGGRTHFGQRSQYVLYKGYRVDLFVTYEVGRYGVLELIRTGPHVFSRFAVTQVHKGGWLFGKYHVKEQAVWLTSSQEEQHVPTEQDFFTYLDCPYIKPNMRGDYADQHAQKLAATYRGRRAR